MEPATCRLNWLRNTAARGPPAPEVPEQTCEKCGKPMAVKRGRFGFFLACTGYPECRNTKKIVMKEGAATAVSDTLLEEKCPECGNQPGAQARPLRAVHCVQQLSAVQIREAADPWAFPVPKKAARVNWSLAARAKARPFTAAAATRTASSPPGINPSTNPAPIAAILSLLEKYKKDGPPDPLLPE